MVFFFWGGGGVVEGEHLLCKNIDIAHTQLLPDPNHALLQPKTWRKEGRVPIF